MSHIEGIGSLQYLPSGCKALLSTAEAYFGAKASIQWEHDLRRQVFTLVISTTDSAEPFVLNFSRTELIQSAQAIDPFEAAWGLIEREMRGLKHTAPPAEPVAETDLPASRFQPITPKEK